jgi:ankyrin repeat protein
MSLIPTEHLSRSILKIFKRSALMKQGNYYFIFIIAIFLILSGCASTTPLIKASTKGDSLAVQKLINDGANINEQDSAGVTPLMYAVSNGDYKLVKMLIDKGADVKVKDKYGYTAFHYAINYDVNYEITKLLMDVDVNAQDGEGRTPLMNSICKGKTDLVKKLIESGVDIRIKDKKGYDALFYAVDYRDIELIKTLIGKGANLETKDLSGITPLVLAASKLPYASSLSKVEMAKRLVKGTDMKAMNPDLTKTVDVIKLLIKSGADINAKNPDGETVLDTALSCSQGYIVDELIKAGANLWVPREGKARLFFVGTDLVK